MENFTCGNCGTLNNQIDEKCLKCGTLLVKPNLDTFSPIQSQPPPLSNTPPPLNNYVPPLPIPPEFSPPPLNYNGELNKQNNKFKFNWFEIFDAGKFPMIIGFILGLFALLQVRFGCFYDLIITMLSAYAGYSYITTINKKQKITSLVTDGVNAAIVSTLSFVVFYISKFISNGITNSGWSIDLSYLIIPAISSAVIGSLAALAWIAYSKENSK